MKSSSEKLSCACRPSFKSCWTESTVYLRTSGFTCAAMAPTSVSSSDTTISRQCGRTNGTSRPMICQIFTLGKIYHRAHREHGGEEFKSGTTNYIGRPGGQVLPSSGFSVRSVVNLVPCCIFAAKDAKLLSLPRSYYRWIRHQTSQPPKPRLSFHFSCPFWTKKRTCGRCTRRSRRRSTRLANPPR